MIHYKYNFETIQIEKPYISLFASGLSINELTENDFRVIKENTYMMGTNYFLLYYIPHLLVFSDDETFKYYDTYLKEHEKPCLFASRPEAFEEDEKNPFIKNIDYWFQVQHYKIRSNYTAIWVLQMLRKLFPDKILLLFGWDFYIPESTECINGVLKSKCYDHKTDYDFKTRKPGKYVKQLDKFEKDLNTCTEVFPGFTDNVWNCNMNSHTTVFKRKTYHEILNLAIN